MPNKAELQKDIDGKFSVLTSIDEKLTKMAGTISERIKRATETLSAENVVVPFTFADRVQEWGTARGIPFADLADLAEWAKDAVQEQVAGFLASQKDTSADSRDALLTQREEIVGELEAYRKLEGMLGVSVPAIPKAPGKRSSSGGSTSKGVKISGIRFYRQVPGKVETDQPDTQNSLGSMASYYTKGVGPDGSAVENGKLSSDQLAALVKSKCGVNNPHAEAWDLTLANGTRIGLRIDAVETTATDSDTTDDETDDDKSADESAA